MLILSNPSLDKQKLAMKDLVISKLAWISKKSFKVTRGQKVKFVKLILIISKHSWRDLYVYFNNIQVKLGFNTIQAKLGFERRIH